jgi:hypothetical protein
MITAKTVSRANVGRPSPASMIDRIRATSMTVTAMVRTSVPYGSPVRWAMTSAWCTQANTTPISTASSTTGRMTAVGGAFSHDAARAKPSPANGSPRHAILR